MHKKRKRTLINSELNRLNRTNTISDSESQTSKLDISDTSAKTKTVDISLTIEEKVDQIESQINKILKRLVQSEDNITMVQKVDNDRKDVIKKLNQNQEELASRCNTVRNMINLNAERIRDVLKDFSEFSGKNGENLKTIKTVEVAQIEKWSENGEGKTVNNSETVDSSSSRNTELDLNNAKLIFEKFELCNEKIKNNSKSIHNIESTLANKYQESVDIINKHTAILTDCLPNDMTRETFQIDLFGKPATYNSFFKARPLFQALQDIISCTKHQFEHHWSNIQALQGVERRIALLLEERGLDRHGRSYGSARTQYVVPTISGMAQCEKKRETRIKRIHFNSISFSTLHLFRNSKPGRT